MKTYRSLTNRILLAFLGLEVSGPLSAATIDSAWSGGATGNWNVPGNWTPMTVPNNGADLYNVTIPSPSAVTINGSFTIQIFAVNSGAAVSLPIGQIFTLNTNSTINGTFTMGQTGSFSTSRLRLGGDVTLGGTGAIELRGVSVIDNSSGGRLTIGAGLTLHALTTNAGFGDFPAYMTLTNNGTIDFEGAGENNLNFADGAFFNTGTFKARNTAVLNIVASNNPIVLNNSGMVEVNNARIDLEGTSVVNTNTIRALNGGVFELSGDFSNTGGILQLESGGKFIPANPFNLTLTGGTIQGAGGIIDQTDFNAGSLTLQGGAGINAMHISATTIQIGSGRTLTLIGDFDFSNNVQLLLSGGTVRVSGAVNLTGSGVLPFALSAATALDTLTLGAGIELRSGISGGFSSVQTVNTAGLVEIQSPDAIIASGATLTSTGALHLLPNAVLTANGAFVKAGGTAQLDASSRLAGGIRIEGGTMNGPGAIRSNTIGLANTSVVNTAIETGASAVTITGAAVVNGTGQLTVNQNSSGTTNLNGAAPGATLTTGSNFGISVTSNHTLASNLPWQFQSNGAFTGGIFVVAADFENDGAITFSGTSQLQLNKNIAAGSTGSITTGSSTTVTVNGASTIGGSLLGSGNLAFSGPTIVTLADYTGTGAIILNTGAKANFSNLVPSVTTLTVNSNNANVSFNGGLTSVGAATINGSGGVFAVTGDTIASGLFRVQNDATHRGPGTTTTQGTLEYRGKLDGRTLVAQGPTTVFQATLQNNAVFENRATLSLLNFGTPNTVTGSGIFRNTAALLQSNVFGSTPNTISSTFEQTNTGSTTASAELTLNGNSTIAGAVTIPAGGMLILGAPTIDTTHNITGAISGQGILTAQGNLLAGSDPTVQLTGQVNLTGANSETIVRDGATLLVQTTSSPRFGSQVQVTRARFKLAESNPPLPVDRVFVTNGVLEGPDAGPRIPFNTDMLTLTGSDTESCRLERLDLHVAQSCSAQGMVDLLHSNLTLDAGATCTLSDGAVITSSTSDGSLECNGGTIEIPHLATVEIAAESNIRPDALNPSHFIVRQGAEVVVSGQVLSSTANLEVFPGGAATFIGPVAFIDTTITAKAGSGMSPGGAITLNDVAELRGCTFTAEQGAEVEITLPTAPLDRGRVLQDKMSAKNGTVTLADFFFPTSFSRFDGTGCFEIKRLLSTGASAGIAPGQSAGRFHLMGDFPFGVGSEILLELGGTTQTTQYDLLAVTGILTATNTSLRPRFLNNFQNTITPANTFTVIETTQPIVGSFFNVFDGRVMATDGTGTFSVTFTNGNTRVVLGDFIPGDVIDSDMDGMSDEFENEFFGSRTGGDPNADDDGDGMTNLQEYRAGTNPIDPNSVLRIDAIRREANNILVVFKTAPDRAYRLVAGSRPTGVFPLIIADIPAAPTAATRTITDTGAATNPPRYYRLVLIP